MGKRLQVPPRSAAPKLPVMVLAAITLATFLPHAMAGDGITAVRDSYGRTVYVNDEAPASHASPQVSAPSSPARSSRLVYWSNNEHCWKAVPAPSRSAASAARSAVAEVTDYIGQQPASENSPAQVNPNYRGVAQGRAVTAKEVDDAIEAAASRHNVDPNLVRALIKVESNFNAHAVSRKGALGLMQLMPQTARLLSVKNPFDPQQNVDAGVRHLKQLLNNFGGDVRLSLAAYNAGEGAVNRSNGIPPYAETRNYVKRITELYAGGNSGMQLYLSNAGPIRVSRAADGVLRITNTD
ncbi:MAG TPA: lytic transglycosylase domain-containing protein [Terriglobales bacterium]|nr:lytic transglycosylase domain-containing protein [Terriglobales bacterium]